MTKPNHVRDFRGYGAHPPDAAWPGKAAVALNFVMNFEEGSEYSLLDGDSHSEGALLEVPQSRVPRGQRDLAAESMYEYGVRVGFWRLRRLFLERGLPLTVFACALAIDRNREAAAAIAEADWDICCHGWRWVEQFRLSEAEQREHIQRAVASLLATTGRRPAGWYCRYAPGLATRRLLIEEGGFLYDSDAYDDELPYWVYSYERPHLVIPYSLAINDTKMITGGLVTATQLFEYLRDSLDMLREEGRLHPRMMNVGMHLRILGHPGRAAALARFLDYASALPDVWICRRDAIARHWIARFPAQCPTVEGGHTMHEIAGEMTKQTTPPGSQHLAPLTGDGFAPFGAVIAPPAMLGERRFYTRWLGSQRAGMQPRFHVNHVPATSLPCAIEALERHPYTAQFFLPLDVASYVIVVAPSGPDGYPDRDRAQCFLASGTVGIVYAPRVWHAGMRVLARPGSFSVLMWRNDSEDDEQRFLLSSPLLIQPLE